MMKNSAFKIVALNAMLFRAMAILLFAVFSTIPTFAQPLTKVRLASTHVFTYVPLLMAKELGYFRAEGLDVEILETQNGTATAAALLGGNVVAIGSSFAQPLLLAEQGKSVKSLVGMEMSSIYVAVVGSKITVAEDDPPALAAALKGKRIGVAALGSPGHLIIEGLLSEHGVSSNEVTYVAIGTGASAHAAFKVGAVEAMITYEPDLSQVMAAGGARIALDLRTTTREKTFSKLPTSSLQATSEWIEKNPDTAAKLVRAIVRANKTLKNDPATSLATFSKLYPSLQPSSLKLMYEASRPNFESTISTEQYGQATATYLKTKQIKKTVPYESAVAAQFVQFWK